MDDRKLLLIHDVLKLDDYIGFEENHTPKDKDRFDNETIEVLQILYDTYLKFLLGYKTMGKAYPSVLELLKIKSPEVISCIENHKEQERFDRQKQNPFRNFPTSNFEEKEEEYCEACHQSPCMCSDREKASTEHDF